MTDAKEFRIERASSERDSSGNYAYHIFKNGHVVATYWHDFRGDEHGIKFTGGNSELWPVGRMTDFLEGGGPSPVELTTKALTYLKKKV